MIRTLFILPLLAATAASAQAGSHRSIMSEEPRMRSFEEELSFSDATIAGDMVFVSGVVVVPDPGDDSMLSAFKETLAKIGRVLKRSGADWSDVVDITSFHTDLRAQLRVMGEAKRELVTPPYPAWTAVGVQSLAGPLAIAEIKVVARVRATPQRH